MRLDISALFLGAWMEIAILFGQSDAENSKRNVVSRRAVGGAWLLW
jgi:hypothetical protein